MPQPCRGKPESTRKSQSKKEAEVHKESPAGKETEGEILSRYFSQDIINQLNVVFSRMEGNLQLDLHLDSRPVSQELKGYMTELEKYTDKLTVQEADSASDSAALLPFVEVLTASGGKDWISFPRRARGHEFTSFILGLYNAAGPGQPP